LSPAAAPFEAPSLEDLRATVPPPPRVRKEDVIARVEQYRRELGAITPLARGEKVARGDEVMLDVVAYAEGKILPFASEVGKKMELKPDPELPGFAEGVEGMAVGSVKKIELRLPPTWADASLKLAPATFEVELRAARRVKPASVTDPAFLAKLGGGTITDVGKRVAVQLEQERRAEAEGRGVKEVLTKLAGRVSYKVPPEDVDAEIRSRWEQVEGKLLAQRKVPEGLRKKALEAWLTRTRLREEVALELKVSLVLLAVGEREGITVKPDALLQEAAPVLGGMGLTEEKAKQQLEKDPRFRSVLTEKVKRFKAVQAVMSRAKVKVSDNLWGL
jgi:trigger factor